jgi:hypothetical protein
MTTEPLSALGWVGVVLFVVSVPLAVIGNVILYHRLRNAGSSIPYLLSGLAAFVYPVYRPSKAARSLDLHALAMNLALLTAVLTVAFLGHLIWG